MSIFCIRLPGAHPGKQYPVLLLFNNKVLPRNTLSTRLSRVSSWIIKYLAETNEYTWTVEHLKNVSVRQTWPPEARYEFLLKSKGCIFGIRARWRYIYLLWGLGGTKTRFSPGGVTRMLRSWCLMAPKNAKNNDICLTLKAFSDKMLDRGLRWRYICCS